ncbi:DUF1646 family protein [Sutcliffiella cohnii]|uniref:Cation transporter n=1 Tax=Sutcliffiella cohnii TaxID=33932 RepID=A0A223KQB7_9BACI|nr:MULTISPECIES: DUF1646 family protein [Sutcliffiella]AST91672.1 cation transporter [Sutcliffiella cohnii]MED4014739.1 DUF1646 family protein [Sutcliffiella cohnii]WBL12894.1 DUF1646 family protein [Sutcliffiella sp. NC1]
MILGLIFIFLLVLFIPLTSRVVERNLELFLFFIGVLAAIVGGVMNSVLFLNAAFAPIYITLAVLGAGFLFKWFRKPLQLAINKISNIIPFRLFVFLVIVFLGLVSSIITAIIAALLLVLIVSSLQLKRASTIRFVVIACFSIGLGAALTPTGEPLATIAINKLDGDFFYLIRLLGKEVILGVLSLGLVGAVVVQPYVQRGLYHEVKDNETYEDILVRSLKIYFFVMGLTFLGEGFEPLIQKYFLGLTPSALYWINMASAILDNATLTAAEISPVMEQETVRSILLGLIISGGMLIPGNIPNIIAAGKLQITSKEWATIGLPLGLLLMIVYYIFMF